LRPRYWREYKAHVRTSRSAAPEATPDFVGTGLSLKTWKPSFVSTHTMEQQIMSGAEQVDFKEIAQSL
jgi:hypothetical protein